jgi:predicted permease
MRLAEDVRRSIKQLAHTPGFTATAVLTVALGVGATTAIFSLVHAVLLKSLPVAKPTELYRVGDIENCCVNGGLQDNWALFSYDKYKTFRDGTPGFTELAAFQASTDLVGVRRVGSAKPAESQRSEYVSGNYFAMFGISAFAGRVLTPDDDRKGAAPVAVMSYGAWQRTFGKDPAVLGGAFTMNGTPVTVVGIAPPGVSGDRLERPPAFFLPIAQEPLVRGAGSLLDFPDQDWLYAIGRLAPGADPKAIEVRLQAELRQWLLGPTSTLTDAERALVPKQTLRLSPGGLGIRELRDEYQDGLRLLIFVSALVLLIACANVANLMLVRATNRRQETSIRAALGASPWRQVQSVLTESVVLALIGGVAGVAVAYLGTELILRLAFHKVETMLHAAPSWPVLAFTFAASLLTGVLFGVAPAFLTASSEPAEALRGATRSTGRGSWAQSSLVVAQAALALVLLCAAGVLTLSLRNLGRQSFGFETENRTILHVDASMAGYRPAQLEELYRELHGRIQALPGVDRVAFSLYSPMEGNNWGETIYVDGEPPPAPDAPETGSSWVRATPDYFDAIGTKVVEGRGFTEQDSQATRPVAVVNLSFAKKFFHDQDPIGRRFGILEAKNAGTFEVVGVTEDTHYLGPSQKVRRMFFLPGAQSVPYPDPRSRAFEERSHYLNAVEIRTRGPVAGLEPQVRRLLAEVNTDLAIIDFQSFADQVKDRFAQRSMIATLTSLFGLVALALASVGLYGVTAYSVERRTAEIGIRMALGAPKESVLGLVLKRAFLQVGLGLAIGLPATIMSGYVLSSQLFRVRAYDPGILALTVLVLSLAAFLASVLPARRAAALDPIRALRTD